MEERFLQSVALLMAVHNPCQRHEMTVSTNNGLDGRNGEVHNLLMQFFTPGSSKIEVFETCFFDILTTQNDISSYAKACFRPYLRVFHPIWVLGPGGGGGGLPRDGCTTCLCSFSTRTAQKSKFSKLVFFDIVTTQNEHPSYVKHVLGRIYVFFTLFGNQVRGRGGGS